LEHVFGSPAYLENKMINENDIIFDNLAEEVFPYLDELRESGVTNMYGAHRYIMEDFSMDKAMAIKLVQAWMETFKEKNDAE